MLAGVASVAFAIGAASNGAPAAQAAQPTTIPGHPELGAGWFSPSTIRGGFGQVAITITKIEGSQLSLQTTDGWTRTIDATGATITRSGQTIAVTDLKVGDQINFRESRQSDGTYKITTIEVLMPTASGTVTAVAPSSVTITQPDGSSKTLTLTGSTTYKEDGATVTQSALVVGVRIGAEGTVDSAGNFTATAITVAPAFVQGTVASKTTSTIVVTTQASKTVTVNVTSTTKYSVKGVASPTLANIAVGDRIVATGSLNADGSLSAVAVQDVPKGQPAAGGHAPNSGASPGASSTPKASFGPNDQPGFGGFGGRGFGSGFGGRGGRGPGGHGPVGPNASPKPSPSAVPGSNV
jgi:hypothetical protein